ncbi:hypothetical protein Emag_003309 [Eimeria magna]
MLELNEEVTMEKEEILTRATDLLKKARGDCLRLGQFALMMRKGHKDESASSVGSTTDGVDNSRALEHMGLSSFGSNIVKALEGPLMSLGSGAGTARGLGSSRPRTFRQVPMYRPVALTIHDLAPSTYRSSSSEGSDSTPRGGDLLNMLPSMPNPLGLVKRFQRNLFRKSSSLIPTKQQQPIIPSSSSSDSDEPTTRPLLVPSTPKERRKSAAHSQSLHKEDDDTWEPQLSSTESGLEVAPCKQEEASAAPTETAETLPTFASLSTDNVGQQESHTKQAGLEETAVSSRERPRRAIRRRAADQYMDVESRRFLAYTRNQGSSKRG